MALSERREYARRRLRYDLAECKENPLTTVAATPLDEKDLLTWHCNITGAEGTDFDGYFFHIEILFPDDYPRSGPRAKVLTQIHHQNVSGDRLYLDLLDNAGHGRHDYGTGWSAAYTVQSILIQLQSFLFEEDKISRVDDSRANAKAFVCEACGHTNDVPYPRPLLSDEAENKVSNTSSESEDELEEVKSAEPTNAPSSPSGAPVKFVGDFGNIPLLKDVPDDVFQVIFSMFPSNGRTARSLMSLSERFARIITLRVDVDRIKKELTCFYSKRPFTEEILGLGMRVDRFRNGMIKLIHPTLDLLGYDAFHVQGQRHGVWKERLDHLLPLYLNKAHGERSIEFAGKAMKEIARSRADDLVWSVLTVIPNLMNTMVVKTMNGGLHESVVALQGYCYFYQLFLAFCERHPEIQEEAERRIEQFVEDEDKRTKQACPALGPWICLLMVSERYFWRDEKVASAYLNENFDRNVRWIVKKYPKLRQQTLQYESNRDYRLNKSFEVTEVSRKLLMFHVLFFKILRCENFTGDDGDTRALPLADVKVRLDQTFGRPDSRMEEQMQQGVKRIKASNTWEDFFDLIDYRSPCPTDDELAQWLYDSMENSARKGYHKSKKHRR